MKARAGLASLLGALLICSVAVAQGDAAAPGAPASAAPAGEVAGPNPVAGADRRSIAKADSAALGAGAPTSQEIVDEGGGAMIQSASPWLDPRLAAERHREEAARIESGGVRYRWGISVFGSPLFLGESAGGTGGLDLRFGAQLSRFFAIYVQPVGIIGASVTEGAGGRVRAIALLGVGMLFDFSFADMFYLAAGPEILYGTNGIATSTSDSLTLSTSPSTFVAIVGRAGLAFGTTRPDRRRAFTVGVNFRVMILNSDKLLPPAIALGYEWF